MNIPKEFFKNLTHGDNAGEPHQAEEGDFFIAPADLSGTTQDLLRGSVSAAEQGSLRGAGGRLPKEPRFWREPAGQAGKERISLAKANLFKKPQVPKQDEENFVPTNSETFLPQEESFTAENIGQLVVDVYQTADEIIIQSTIAGVDVENLDISVSGDTVVIKGKRSKEEIVNEADYFCQECYWGSFARTIILPAEIEPEKTRASLKNGILTIRLPKAKKNLVKKIKISTE